MKVSVYIPDDLWQQVQQQDADFKLSPFVQQGLRDRFGARSERPYAKLGDIQQRNVAAARTRILDQMTGAYQAGYNIGLDFAQQLPWRAFVDFESAGWDLETWRRDFDDVEYEIVNRDRSSWAADAAYIAWDDVMAIVTEMEESIPLGPDGLPTGLPREGFVDAIRAVWDRTPARDIDLDDAVAPAPERDGEAQSEEGASDGHA